MPHIQKGQRAVKDIMRSKTGSESAATARRDELRKARKREKVRCSICTHRTWLRTFYLMEPAGVPDPRQTWSLCESCHAALLEEMRRSPVRSPLRLRIAVGIVASERSPYVYAPSFKPLKERSWLIIIAWLFVITMLLHLAIIVLLAFFAGH